MMVLAFWVLLPYLLHRTAAALYPERQIFDTVPPLAGSHQTPAPLETLARSSQCFAGRRICRGWRSPNEGEARLNLLKEIFNKKVIWKVIPYLIQS